MQGERFGNSGVMEGESFGNSSVMEGESFVNQTFWRGRDVTDFGNSSVMERESFGKSSVMEGRGLWKFKRYCGGKSNAFGWGFNRYGWEELLKSSILKGGDAPDFGKCF